MNRWGDSDDTMRTGQGLRLRLLGSRIRVESESDGFLTALARCFDPAAGRDEGDTAGDDLRLEVLWLARSPGWDVVATPRDGARRSWLVQDAHELCGVINEWAVAAASDDHVFHAGAVASQGRGVLLPGASGSGKSTLTTALLGAGFDLLSDEVAVVGHASRALRPYPRCLSLRHDVLDRLGLAPEPDGDADPSATRMVHPTEIGRRFATGPVPTALIVAPRFVADGPTELRRLSPGQAVLTLMESACSLRHWKVQGLDWVIALVTSVPAYALSFADLDEAVACVQRACSAHGSTRP